MSEAAGVAASQESLGDAARRFLLSSVGAKIVMALSGVGLGLFIVNHLLGNLLVFAGPNASNAYAKGLKDLGPILWLLRGGILLAAIAHVWAGIRCKLHDRAARPVRYVNEATRAASFASRTMAVTGLLLLAFLFLHLDHFTFGISHPQFITWKDAEGRHDVYRMTIAGFQSVPYSIVYVVAQVLLALHLSHGLHSLFQHLGIFGKRLTRVLQLAGQAAAWIISLAFISIPLAVLLGIVK